MKFSKFSNVQLDYMWQSGILISIGSLLFAIFSLIEGNKVSEIYGYFILPIVVITILGVITREWNKGRERKYRYWEFLRKK